MVRVSGIQKMGGKRQMVTSIDPVGADYSDMGMDVKDTLRRLESSQRLEKAIGNAARPSNLYYKITGQASYWYMYALMDWYKSEVSVLSTIIERSTTELFRYDIELRPKFAFKCEDCGEEMQTFVKECPHCGSKRLRQPDATQKEYFVRPNGKSFIDEANDNGQSLKDVLKSYAESQYQNNQGYILCVTGDIYDKETGKLDRAYPLEFISQDPKFVKYLYDETGKPGTNYAFTRDNRNMLINLDKDEDALNAVTEQGKELYPAAWQIGQNYGATGKYWVYTSEEIYQDHWFRPSLIYGIPIWFDIEDDLLIYHYLEKHFLKKFKFGYVRKMVILPGFNDEDVEDITKGIQDILATNDNSIPIVCTPPQLPGTAEMKAQTLELAPESSEDALAVKDDIRNRLCAHIGVPNLFAGDVEQSGGMNNESQQITVYDRYLMDKYNYIDTLCKWILSWFPKITDYELVVCRPSKAYTDMKRRMDKMQEAGMMKQLGFEVYYRDGDFYYSEEPVDQVQMRQQMEQQQMMAAMGATMDPNAGMMDGGLMPGDGDGPPEKGTARREDDEIDASEDEVDLAKREANTSSQV